MLDPNSVELLGGADGVREILATLARHVRAARKKRAGAQQDSAELEATREAFDQAQRAELMTLGEELMDRIAETGEVPEFVRDPE